MPSPNTHRFLVLQISPLDSEQRHFFFQCTSAMITGHCCSSVAFFTLQIGYRPVKLFSNIHDVPSKTSKSRKIRIVAGRRFWRFLLVNQLPLSIMPVHEQYRAAAPLNRTFCLEKRVVRVITNSDYRAHSAPPPFAKLGNLDVFQFISNSQIYVLVS